MILLRKILVVKTKGSRKLGNLKPIIAERLPKGVNLNVLKYLANDTLAIVEVWGTDHPLYPYRINESTLKELASDDSVLASFDDISELTEYLTLEEIEKIKKQLHHEIGISLSQIQTKALKIDLKKRTFTYKGTSYPMKGKKTIRGREVIVIDEG